MWMATYGIVLWTMAYSRNIMPLPLPFCLWAVGLTAVFTLLIPTGMIALMKSMGMVSDMYLRKKEERRWPYIFTIVCYGMWCYALGMTLKMPWEMVETGIGATLAIGLVMLINRWWKISAHMTGIGGLIGGTLHYYHAYHTLDSVWPIVVLLTAAWVIAWARLYLDEHTDGQVVAGLLLGMVCTGIL